jgi:hypothetical protein
MLLIPKSDLSTEEAKVIRALERLRRSWPKNLWLFVQADSGQMSVMRRGEDGGRVMGPDGPSSLYAIYEFTGVEADGGFLDCRDEAERDA